MSAGKYVYTFSGSGIVSGGRDPGELMNDMPVTEMPGFAQYYVNDSDIALPFGTRLSPVLADWIDIAVAAYFADRFALRQPQIASRQEHNWGRSITLRVGVRQPHCWNRPEVLNALTGLLGFITGDKWGFEFIEFEGEPRVSELNGQGSLFPLESPSIVALFSGGLDSFAGLAKTMLDRPDYQFVLVSGVTNSRQQAGQRKQVRAIINEIGRSVTHVTVPLRRSWKDLQDAEEWSQRARGFLFLTLGSATAISLQNKELFVFENGIGAINLPINGTQVGTYNSRAVNPITLMRMSHFVRLLTGQDFSIYNPFLFQTKGEMCSNGALVSLTELISETFSCDGFPVHSRGRPQCGTCSSCILRRLSLLRAKLQHHDSGYLVDLYAPSKPLSQNQQYVLRAMCCQAQTITRQLHTDKPWESMVRAFPALSRIEDVLVTNRTIDRENLRSSLLRLYREYLAEWKNFESRCPLFSDLGVRAA
jgi:7-cyano-7-deazaguanine synthase in queuosine biosynthesis